MEDHTLTPNRLKTQMNEDVISPLSITFNLSELEQLVMMAIRSCTEESLLGLRESLKEADKK